MTSAVIVGASGGIGQALVGRLSAAGAYDRLFALSRAATEVPGQALGGRI